MIIFQILGSVAWTGQILCGGIDDICEGQAESIEYPIALFAVSARKVELTIIDEVAILYYSLRGEAGGADIHPSGSALCAHSCVFIGKGAVALVYAFSISEGVSRLAGHTGPEVVDFDAVQILHHASPGDGVQYPSVETLRAFTIFVEKASVEHALADVPDILEGGPAGDAVGRLIVCSAILDGVFCNAVVILSWRKT